MERFFLFFFIFLSILHSQTLTFGVFKYRTADKIVQEYEPLVKHIAHELNMEIVLKPLGQRELEEELKLGKIDIIATNPTHYLFLQKQLKTTGSIATLVKRYDDVVTPYLGGVIIALQERKDLRSMSMLRGKTFAIGSKKMLGGYQTQALEFLKAGVDIEKDVSMLTCETHEGVVEAVLTKKADVGFIRSGIFEEMQLEKKIDSKDFFIINEQKFSYFPLKISTALYPEWSIVASKELSVDIVSKIAVALYGYNNSQKGNDIIAGFTIPGDYAEIDSLARELRIPPYNYIPSFTFEDIFYKYGIFIGILVFMTILFFSVLLFLYQRTSFEKKYALSILNATPNPTIVTDGESLVSANTAFLNYVHFQTLESFKESHNCICDLFEKGDTEEYLSAHIDEKTWVEYIVENPQKEHKVKITIAGETSFFKVDVSSFVYKNKLRAIVIFSDISQLVNQSTIDALTQIANRTHFNLLLKYSLSVAEREKNPLSFIFFDIDHFKGVNDTYGHLVGDDVLRHLAKFVQHTLRKSDIIARWGGEEFVILLANTPLHAASQIAQTLRKEIASEPFEVVGSLTCSFGVTQLQENEEPEALFLRLDALLYEAKKNGRNRVEAG